MHIVRADTFMTMVVCGGSLNAEGKRRVSFEIGLGQRTG